MVMNRSSTHTVFFLAVAATAAFCSFPYYNVEVRSSSASGGRAAAGWRTSPKNLRRVSTDQIEGEKHQLYDLILEYQDGETMVNQACVERIVKDELPKKVFIFMEENHAIESDQRKEFLDDWSVDVTDVEEVNILTMEDPLNPCKSRDECTAVEILDPADICDGDLCGNRRLQDVPKTQNTKKRRRKKVNKKLLRKRFLVRSRAKCTTMCFTDNKDKGRKLLTPRADSVGDRLDGEFQSVMVDETSESRHQGGHSGSDDLLRRMLGSSIRLLDSSSDSDEDTSEEDASGDADTRDKGDSSTTADAKDSNTQYSAQSSSKKETEKTHIQAPPDNSEDHSKYQDNKDGEKYKSWDLKTIIEVWMERSDWFRRFQEDTAKRFQDDLDRECQELLENTKFFYVPILEI